MMLGFDAKWTCDAFPKHYRSHILWTIHICIKLSLYNHQRCITERRKIALAKLRSSPCSIALYKMHDGRKWHYPIYVEYASIACSNAIKIKLGPFLYDIQASLLSSPVFPSIKQLLKSKLRKVSKS